MFGFLGSGGAKGKGQNPSDDDPHPTDQDGNVLAVLQESSPYDIPDIQEKTPQEVFEQLLLHWEKMDELHFEVREKTLDNLSPIDADALDSYHSFIDAPEHDEPTIVKMMGFALNRFSSPVSDADHGDDGAAPPGPSKAKGSSAHQR
uniref:Uncharacterized protein n=1 Tax=Chromera velia CCMP2878 TaxID=1169474 RepID=A0A0G4HYT1_9ALVE|eukprot:Cvel_9555.t1-p1 / transcript=Cvel_9555.t1 / gene=Cvel_9555 / organism=Chromera_velia_CCMP2878 / gene_product=hypothetical protein / transcript_product=hypothetical protein / location=Cvel_scaffold553:58946-59383(+) / protein_length=146 / sequence_SO=supercontig / SO=protein_coding / is_pseudo=false